MICRKQTNLLDCGKAFYFRISTRKIVKKTNMNHCHTNRGNIDSSHTIYVFCQMNLPTIYDTVDGRNPAPPWMYKTLSVMGSTTISTGAGFLPSKVCIIISRKVF